MRSARLATTARSWVTYSAATPYVRVSSFTVSQHVRLGRDVEAGRRLVEHDQRRPAGERHGDGDALLLPAGELVRVAAQEGLVARQAAPRPSSPATRASRSASEAPKPWTSSISMSWVPMRRAGLSDIEGSCGTYEMSAAADAAQLVRVHLAGRRCPLMSDSAARHDRATALVHEQRRGGCRLAGGRLAHEASTSPLRIVN